MSSQGRPHLRTSLERDIYPIIKGIEESHLPGKRITTLMIYQYIRESNSSLARQKKKALEVAIDHVLFVRKWEIKQDEAGDSDAELERMEVDPPKKERDTFLLNKHITKHWGVQPAAALNKKNDGGKMDVDSRSKTANATPTIERQNNGESKSKRRRTEKEKDNRSPPTGMTLEDFGGIDALLDELEDNVFLPMAIASDPGIAAEEFAHIPRGILLHGPPGCGKTTLVGALAAEMGVSYIPVSAPTMVAGMSGESEGKIRDAFEEAKRLAPSILFFDEIDVIMGKREMAQREMEKRMVAQMSTLMDEISQLPHDRIVLVFAATNRPDSMDDSLRRGGRFETELSLGMPDETGREMIVRALTKSLTLPEDFDYSEIAKRTPGFVGADLKSMVGMAKQIGGRRIMEARVTQVINASLDVAVEALSTNVKTNRRRLFKKCLTTHKHVGLAGGATTTTDVEGGAGGIEMVISSSSSNPSIFQFNDFLKAIGKVQPMAKREGFTAIPDTTWEQVGALHDVRHQLYSAITGPIEHPERWGNVGITAASGVLLWGPPGCGKTLLAKAVANEAKANFISIKGPELLNKYVGESERAVRQLFARARQSNPCVLFFDELDSLVPSRDDSLADSGHRVVNAMLTELDGIDNRKGVYIIAATNRPDRIDPAVLRPGRLGTPVFVDLPTAEERVEILRTIVKSRLTKDKVEGQRENVELIARDDKAEGFSGADLGNLHVVAANRCLVRAPGAGDPIISLEDWEYALGRVRKSVQNPEEFRVRMRKVLEKQTRH